MASIATGLLTCAPGNIASIPCDGFAPGAGSMLFLAQGGYGNVTVTVNGAIGPNSAAIPGQPGAQAFTFPVPDGLVSDSGLLSDVNAATASVALRVVSQYVSADEYLASGEMANCSPSVSSLATGDLDAILRRASSYADEFMGEGVRYLQKMEHHKYSAPRNDSPPRLFPYRTRGRAARCPILSIDSLTFVSAANLITTFNDNDVYVNPDAGYLEILAYAVGNYALLGALQMIGYSANVFEVLYTSGFQVAKYPAAVREAVTMMATSLLQRRMLQQMGITGLLTTGSPLKTDPKNPESGAGFRMPIEAKRMLAPYCCFSVQ